MRKVLVVVFNLLTTWLLAQSDAWHPGAVVTSDDAVIKGEILFHPGFDLLVVSNESGRSVLAAHSVKSFRFFDRSLNVNRKFIAIRDLYGAVIYEVVLSGEVAVLRKPVVAYPSSDRDDYRYYFLSDGILEKLTKFRTVLYPRLRNLMSAEENAFHLNPNVQADAIRYIDLYNRKLSQKNLVAAR